MIEGFSCNQILYIPFSSSLSISTSFILTGVTGGLAAPLIASGLGVIIGTAGGAALATTAGVAVIGSLFGAAGAGLAGVLVF